MKHLAGCEHISIEANYDLNRLISGPYPPSLKKRISGRGGHLSNQQTADILAEITKVTQMLTISIGSGSKADVQFLFAEDILGYHFDSARTPRHAKSYRNFNKIYSTIQTERINAFKKFQSDVELKKFPSKKHSVMADKKELITIFGIVSKGTNILFSDEKSLTSSPPPEYNLLETAGLYIFKNL